MINCNIDKEQAKEQDGMKKMSDEDEEKKEEWKGMKRMKGVKEEHMKAREQDEKGKE